MNCTLREKRKRISLNTLYRLFKGLLHYTLKLYIQVSFDFHLNWKSAGSWMDGQDCYFTNWILCQTRNVALETFQSQPIFTNPQIYPVLLKMLYRYLEQNCPKKRKNLNSNLSQTSGNREISLTTPRRKHVFFLCPLKM